MGRGQAEEELAFVPVARTVWLGCQGTPRLVLRASSRERLMLVSSLHLLQRLLPWQVCGERERRQREREYPPLLLLSYYTGFSGFLHPFPVSSLSILQRGKK